MRTHCLLVVALLASVCPTLAHAQPEPEPENDPTEIALGVRANFTNSLGSDFMLGGDLGLDLRAHHYRAGVVVGYASAPSLFDDYEQVRAVLILEREFDLTELARATGQLSGGPVWATAKTENEDREQVEIDQTLVEVGVGVGIEVGETDGISFLTSFRGLLMVQVGGEESELLSSTRAGAEFSMGIRVGL